MLRCIVARPTRFARRHRLHAGLVTDDASVLHETLEAATGDRVSVLDGIGAILDPSSLGLERPQVADQFVDLGRRVEFLGRFRVGERPGCVLHGGFQMALECAKDSGSPFLVAGQPTTQRCAALFPSDFEYGWREKPK